MNNQLNNNLTYIEKSPILDINFQGSESWEMSSPGEDLFNSQNPLFMKDNDNEMGDLNNESNKEKNKKELEDFLMMIKSKEKEDNEFDKSEGDIDMDFFKRIPEQEFAVPIPEKDKKETEDISNKTTDDKTKGNPSKINKPIFGLNSPVKIEARIDYSIKNFKVFLMQFLKDYGNNLIKDCNFTDELKNKKLFSASYKYFTGVSSEQFNKRALKFTMEEIFTYPSTNVKKNDNRLQMQNKEIIGKIKEYIRENYEDEDTIPEEMEKVEGFFKMQLQEAIHLFYDSKQFNKYASSQKTIFLNEQFKKFKGFSLSEKNGFIRHLRE